MADRERKRLSRSCETAEMKQKRNEADKIRKRLVLISNPFDCARPLLTRRAAQMRGMETPEAKRRRREAEKLRRVIFFGFTKCLAEFILIMTSILIRILFACPSNSPELPPPAPESRPYLHSQLYTAFLFAKGVLYAKERRSRPLRCV